jgi:hypothetical protein
VLGGGWVVSRKVGKGGAKMVKAGIKAAKKGGGGGTGSNSTSSSPPSYAPTIRTAAGFAYMPQCVLAAACVIAALKSER